MAASRRSQVLARVNFPLFTVYVLTERHVLVAGGGGEAKTGIPNVIEIYELINNGSTCRAESVAHYETGRQAIMNCTVFYNGKYFVLAAGMEGTCQIYQMKYKLLSQETDGEVNKPKDTDHSENSKSTLRQRRRTSSTTSENENDDEEAIKSEHKIRKEAKENSNATERKRKVSDSNSNSIPTRIGFCIQPLQSFQTDFSKDEDLFQKVVRYSPALNILVTAGADGHLRVWKYPELVMTYDINAHNDDVDDLDVSPLGRKIVSVSRDGHGYVWNTKDGSKVCELQLTLPNKAPVKYIFRSCRFGIVEGDGENAKLFTSHNPAVRSKPPSPCYLCKWSTNNFVVERIVSTGVDMLSVMSVSDDGRFVGLGTQSGNVYIYIAFSLQKLYHAERAHSIFVTGIEFLKTTEETKRITGDKDTSLISISVDNHINIHHIPKPATMGVFMIAFVFIGALLSAYVLMDYLNL